MDELLLDDVPLELDEDALLDGWAVEDMQPDGLVQQDGKFTEVLAERFGAGPGDTARRTLLQIHATRTGTVRKEVSVCFRGKRDRVAWLT